jgi:tetratricopeptide (TPR) repeat protein
VGLLPVYPRWSLNPPSILCLLSLPVLIFLLVLLFNQQKESSRHVLLGLGFFLINLAPVAGIIGMSYMNASWVADHLVYLPMLGLIGLSVAASEALYLNFRIVARPYLIIIATILIIFLIQASRFYASNWTSNEALWSYTIESNPDSCLAHIALGYSWSQIPDRMPDAIREFRTAIALNPTYANAHCNLGHALSRIGHPIEAIAEYKYVLRFAPDDTEAHLGLGEVLEKMPGHLADAVNEYRAAVKIKPGYVTYNRLGNVLSKMSDQSLGASEAFQSALRFDPSSAPAHFNYANTLATIPGKLSDAISEYETALRLDPDLAGAHTNLAAILMNIPARLPEAIAHFREAVRLQPNDEAARRNLTIAEQILLK